MNDLEQYYQGKKVLVTGGAGFIGSHLTEKLVQLGAQVTVLDNFSTGTLSNLKPIITRINLMYADITSRYSCLKATIGKDIVFHLGAFISVPLSITNPEICNTVNIDGTKNLLESCKQNNVNTFAFSSSAAVYGNKETICNEDDPPNALSPYAMSKLKGEQLCKQYAQNYDINSICLRYFNVYGERQNPNGQYAAVVAKFKDCLFNKKPITIFGDGKQTRDFIHVAKVVEANLTLAMRPHNNGEIFNIATGKSINLLELIKQLESEFGIKPVDVTYKPARVGDIAHSQADASKYLKNKPFSPRVPQQHP